MASDKRKSSKKTAAKEDEMVASSLADVRSEKRRTRHVEDFGKTEVVSAPVRSASKASSKKHPSKLSVSFAEAGVVPVSHPDPLIGDEANQQPVYPSESQTSDGENLYKYKYTEPTLYGKEDYLAYDDRRPNLDHVLEDSSDQWIRRVLRQDSQSTQEPPPNHEERGETEDIGSDYVSGKEISSEKTEGEDEKRSRSSEDGGLKKNLGEGEEPRVIGTGPSVLFLGDISFLDSIPEDNVQFLPTCESVRATGYSNYAPTVDCNSYSGFSFLEDNFPNRSFKDCGDVCLDSCVDKLVGFNFHLEDVEAREANSFNRVRKGIEEAVGRWEQSPLSHYQLDRVRIHAKAQLILRPPPRKYWGEFSLANDHFLALNGDGGGGNCRQGEGIMGGRRHLASAFDLLRREKYSSVTSAPAIRQQTNTNKSPSFNCSSLFSRVPSVKSGDFSRSTLGLWQPLMCDPCNTFNPHCPDVDKTHGFNVAQMSTYF